MVATPASHPARKRTSRPANPRSTGRQANSPPTTPNPSPESSDAILAVAYRAGSNPAGDALLTRHAGLLRSAVRSVRVPPHVSPDDLLQVARIAFLRAACTWDPESATGSKLTTYATVCVRRAVLRELDRARNAPLPQAATDDASPDALASVDPAAADAPAGVVSPLAVVSDLGRVALLLAHLTPRQRLAVEHRYGLRGLEPATTWAMLGRRLRVGEKRARELHDEGVERLRAAVEAG